MFQASAASVSSRKNRSEGVPKSFAERIRQSIATSTIALWPSHSMAGVMDEFDHLYRRAQILDRHRPPTENVGLRQ